MLVWCEAGGWTNTVFFIGTIFKRQHDLTHRQPAANKLLTKCSKSPTQADIVLVCPVWSPESRCYVDVLAHQDLLTPGSVSCSPPQSCDPSLDCDLWRPPSPSSSPGTAPHNWKGTTKRLRAFSNWLPTPFPYPLPLTVCAHVGLPYSGPSGHHC